MLRRLEQIQPGETFLVTENGHMLEVLVVELLTEPLIIRLRYVVSGEEIVVYKDGETWSEFKPEFLKTHKRVPQFRGELRLLHRPPTARAG